MRPLQEIEAEIEVVQTRRRELLKELASAQYAHLIGKTFTGELGTLTVTGIEYGDFFDRIVGSISGYSVQIADFEFWWSPAPEEP